MQVDVIFEDTDLVVLNKPAGIVVNEADSVKGETIQAWLAEKLSILNLHSPVDPSAWSELVPADFANEYGSPEEIFSQRQGLVHRLDKDTSGVMVAAKNPGALVNLLAQFRLRQVQKEYTCLVHGKLRVPRGIIDAPLGRARVDRQKFAVVADGRTAVTAYEVLTYFTGLNDRGLEKLGSTRNKASIYQGFSLVKARPKTGRTHQVRVHMKHWQHPLVGDHKYVGKKRTRLDKLWCKRQFLHASQISFTHPRTQEKLVFTAQLTSDLQASMGLLEKA